MTKDELAAIRERCERATPGPWTYIPDSYGYVWCRGGQQLVFDAQDDQPTLRPRGVGAGLTDEQLDANAAFVAHARTDIPMLLAEVERLEQQIRDIKAIIVDKRSA